VPYLLLVIGVLITGAALLRYTRGATREQIATLIIIIGTLTISGVVFLLAITGRLPAIFGIATAIWPLLYSIWKSYQQVKTEEKVYSHLSSLSVNMARAEALAVLGLKEDPTEEAIRAAHKRLMQRLHPDTQGSEWLAQKINTARDILLKHLDKPA
jgi:uncharacterized membrane protein